MADPAVAAHLANTLTEGRLEHPGTFGPSGQPVSGPVPLPFMSFRNNGMPPEQADHFAKEAGLPHSNVALLVAEACIHDVEAGGDYVIIAKSELDKLYAAAQAAEPLRHRQPHIHCVCNAPLFKLLVTDFNTETPRVNGPELIRTLAKLSPECALAHRPVATQEQS